MTDVQISISQSAAFLRLLQHERQRGTLGAETLRLALALCWESLQQLPGYHSATSSVLAERAASVRNGHRIRDVRDALQEAIDALEFYDEMEGIDERIQFGGTRGGPRRSRP